MLIYWHNNYLRSQEIHQKSLFWRQVGYYLCDLYLHCTVARMVYESFISSPSVRECPHKYRKPILDDRIIVIDGYSITFNVNTKVVWMNEFEALITTYDAYIDVRYDAYIIWYDACSLTHTPLSGDANPSLIGACTHKSPSIVCLSPPRNHWREYGIHFNIHRAPASRYSDRLGAVGELLNEIGRF